MDAVRDLGRSEPWQESLERSRARREQARRSFVERDQRHRTDRRPRTGAPQRRATAARAPATDRTPARPRRPTRRRIAVRRAVAVLGLTLCVALLLSALDDRGAPGRGTQGPTMAAQLPISKSAELRYDDSGGAGPLSHWPVSQALKAGLTRACQPTSWPSGYVDPLAGAHVKPERIDQGVDYAGSGALAAIGSGTVTYVATSDTGWPGSFIEYRLRDGADAGCYVYYAEGVNPAAGLRVGETVAAGQPIAQIIAGWPTGIELGWGAGVNTATYAAATHQWSAASDQDSAPTAAGKSFSALMAAVGGPPGKVEG